MSSYRIEKIADLLRVPADRRAACVRNVLYALDLHELAFGGVPDAPAFGAVEWTDDDDLSVDVVSAEDGSSFLKLEIAQKPKDNTR